MDAGSWRPHMTDDWRTRAITPQDADAISRWTYDEPYSLYNSSPEDAAWYLDPANNYVSIVDSSDELVAFGCVGHDARVPGGSYDDDAIDFGSGMRPDLTGQGHGARLIELMIDEARRALGGTKLRSNVAAFNERALPLHR